MLLLPSVLAFLSVLRTKTNKRMSCNGCRVLRKGCSENCILRLYLEWIQNLQAQAHATLFVTKFSGRAGLMSFISSVPHKQGPALFQSLLIEACDRMVNPVNGAVVLLWTGHWHECQAAVETVLCGGTLQEVSEPLVKTNVNLNDRYKNQRMNHIVNQFNLPQDFNHIQERDNEPSKDPMSNLGLSLKTFRSEKFHSGASSMISEESETTNCFEIVGSCDLSGQRRENIKLLNLFSY